MQLQPNKKQQIEVKNKIYYPTNYKKRTEQEFKDNVARFFPQEQQTAKLMSQILNDKNYVFNEDKYFDIRFLDKDIKIEVKTDTRMTQTNNVFIETNYKNKPNGIYDTQAYYFCINDNNGNYYLITTEKLKELVSNKNK